MIVIAPPINNRDDIAWFFKYILVMPHNHGDTMIMTMVKPYTVSLVLQYAYDYRYFLNVPRSSAGQVTQVWDCQIAPHFLSTQEAGPKLQLQAILNIREAFPVTTVLIFLS